MNRANKKTLNERHAKLQIDLPSAELTRPDTIRSRYAGFTLLEMLACLLVIMQFFGYIALYVRTDLDTQTNRVCADQLNTITQGAVYYVKDNLKLLMEDLAEAEISEIALTTLISKGYVVLDGDTYTNPQGQSYKVAVQKITPDNSTTPILRIFVYTTGGKVIDRSQLAKMAAYLGGQGGYLPDSTDDTKSEGILGAFKAWYLSLDDLAVLGLEPGHVLTLNYLTQKSTAAQDASLFLNRIAAEDGTTTANTMETDLIIGSNQKLILKSGASIELENGTVLAEDLFALGGVLIQNSTIRLPTSGGKIFFTQNDGDTIGTTFFDSSTLNIAANNDPEDHYLQLTYQSLHITDTDYGELFLGMNTPREMGVDGNYFADQPGPHLLLYKAKDQFAFLGYGVPYTDRHKGTSAIGRPGSGNFGNSCIDGFYLSLGQDFDDREVSFNAYYFNAYDGSTNQMTIWTYNDAH